MLWDLIRDFFVQHVFGGVDSNGTIYNALIGRISYGEYDYDDIINGVDVLLPINGIYYQMDSPLNGISFSDWLSTTATAISITIIVVLCCLFIYKIVRLIGGLIR